MLAYTYTKIINSDRLISEIADAGITVNHIDTIGESGVLIYVANALSPENIVTLGQIVEIHQPVSSEEYVEGKVKEAIAFGQALRDRFVKENILLGITQANMTNIVRKRLKEVTDAIKDGGLKDAIYEIRQIPVENRDGVFVSDARLLKYVNLIEEFLGLPLSTEL